MAEKSMRPGGGGRFAAFKKELEKHYDDREAGAIAAAAGRKKYGKAKFQKMAAAGRRRAGE